MKDSSLDLMALESNAIFDSNQNRLIYYTTFPMKSAAGANVYLWDLFQEENAYVFQQFYLVFPVLRFLQESRISRCTMIVPALNSAPMRWPLM